MSSIDVCKFFTFKPVIQRPVERWLETSREKEVCLFSHNVQHLTLSQMKILDPSKLKEFADDNFKFDENGRKFS